MREEGRICGTLRYIHVITYALQWLSIPHSFVFSNSKAFDIKCHLEHHNPTINVEEGIEIPKYMY